MNALLLVNALIATMLWGIIPIFQKPLLTKYPYIVIYVLTGLAHVFMLLVMAIYHRKQLMTHIPHVTSKEWGIIVFAIALLTVIANLVYMMTLKNNESYLVVALTSVYPLFTLLFAYVYLHEHVSLLSIAGVAFIVTGICMLTIPNNVTTAVAIAAAT